MSHVQGVKCEAGWVVGDGSEGVSDLIKSSPHSTLSFLPVPDIAVVTSHPVYVWRKGCAFGVC